MSETYLIPMEKLIETPEDSETRHLPFLHFRMQILYIETNLFVLQKLKN